MYRVFKLKTVLQGIKNRVQKNHAKYLCMVFLKMLFSFYASCKDMSVLSKILSAEPAMNPENKSPFSMA